MYHIEPLKKSDVGYYSTFTYARFRDGLESRCDDENSIVLSASGFQKPVGLMIAWFDRSKNQGWILSLFVASLYRNQGVGTRLLQAAEEALGKKGCPELRIYFPIDDGQSSPLASSLHKCGWSNPMKADEISKFDISRIPWRKNVSFRGNDLPLPWENITPEQLAEVRDGEGSQYPVSVSPFQNHLKKYNPLTSFWLVRDGKVLGWIVTVTVAKDTLSYERVYMLEQVQKTGAGLSLITHVATIQLSLGMPFGSAMINYSECFYNEPLIRFFNHRIKPYFVFCRGYYTSNKVLSRELIIH